MPKEPMHFVQLDSCLNQSRGKRMPQVVEMKILDSGFLQRQPEGSP
jgi:hypothetical protein